MKQFVAFAIVFAAAATALPVRQAYGEPAGQVDDAAASTSSPQAAARAGKLLAECGVRGGLVVHVGCGASAESMGALTAALRASDSYIVHGLAADAGAVARARAFVRSAGLCGPVSIDQLRGARLPYVDNLVNLVVADELGKVPMSEVMRVLSPGGVAMIGGKKTVKARPGTIDEWTHYLHDAGNNAVAHDAQVGPPRHIQWLADPLWCRYHHTLASISAVVSAGGRIFYIVDEGPSGAMSVPGRWQLVGRDAFNGTLLWTRPMASWAWHLHGFRSGPVQLPRTLVAGGSLVLAPLAMSAPVAAIDAATGEVVRTFAGTQGAEELILNDNILFVLAGAPMAEQAGIDPARKGEVKSPNDKCIVAVNVNTGRQLWRWSETDAGRVMPLTLAAGARQVFFQAGKGVTCLDAATGKQLWQGPAGAPAETPKPAKTKGKGKKTKKGAGNPRGRGIGSSSATLVVSGGVVLWGDGRQMTAMSAETGKALWSCPAPAGFRSPADIFVIDSLVWLGPLFTEGRDLRTGEVRKRNDTARGLWTVGHHHRCYREKATDRYILTGKRGVEFVDLVGDGSSRNNWVRGDCQYGVMPCNGLLYAPSHACGCFMEAKIRGFLATATQRQPAAPPARQAQGKPADGVRLEKGPAYGAASAAAPQGAKDQWPTLRHDALRSGSTLAEVPAALKVDWQVSIGGRLAPSLSRRLTAPVVADGLVVVASIDDHRVIALDSASGAPKWSFEAGGRVDSPPTLYRGLALLGCADGWAYCLRLSDGQLVWRFRAAPEPLNTVVLDQVESVWPVCGSVLVQNGIAYVAAGRSSYLDGGIQLFGLDPATGKVIHKSVECIRHPKGAEGIDSADVPASDVRSFVQNATDRKTFAAPDRSDAFSMAGATNDVLVSDGEAIYLRAVKFDAKLAPQPVKGRHLFSTSGLLDDAENHRSHWVLGTADFSRLPVAYSWIANRPGGAYNSRLARPYGIMLSFDDKTVWGVRRAGKVGRDGVYKLFAEDNRPFSRDEKPEPDFVKATGKGAPSWSWAVEVSLRPRAMLRAGKVIFLGCMDNLSEADKPYDVLAGKTGGTLLAMSAEDGKELGRCKLSAPPVWDGLAAVAGKLYVCTMDGRVLCLSAAEVE